VFIASILYPKPCDCKGLNGLLCFRAGHLTVPFGLRSAYVEYPALEPCPCTAMGFPDNSGFPRELFGID
ncbi:MAG: hypothetical protein D3916_12405, partial [Candidatus Electrothrix sp. MAN1_4]|nr:hypothetical protein [Candidatus Electrothrix sp. MAN1_4]